ncbi:MAG: hypothetical protein QNK30_08965 [Bacteroidales bacterium]|nr:hypothetical protein [Bacteroidales bacterium]
MKKITLIIFIVFAGITARSQLIDNNINFFLSYSAGSFLGEEMTIEDNFNYPALFSNFQDVSGYKIQVLVKKGNHLSYGAGMELMEASDWVLPGHTDFRDSRMTLYSLSPEIKIHTGFQTQGIFNRLRLYGSLAPSFGVILLNLAESPFEIQGTDTLQSTFLENRELFAGFSGSMGMEYALSQGIGLFIEYSQHFSWASSLVFQESAFFRSQVQFGLMIRILKDKRYYYYQ